MSPKENASQSNAGNLIIIRMMEKYPGIPKRNNGYVATGKFIKLISFAKEFPFSASQGHTSKGCSGRTRSTSSIVLGSGRRALAIHSAS